MPDFFSPFTLKGLTLRDRIAMSPMTMYRSVDGLINDFHVMLMGSRARAASVWYSPNNWRSHRMAVPAPVAPGSTFKAFSRPLR